jgi:hypothetical protein
LINPQDGPQSPWLALTYKAPTSPVAVEPYDWNNPNQVWVILQQDAPGTGLVALGAMPTAAAKEKQCLDLFSAKTSDGSPVYTYLFHDANNQFWTLKTIGDAPGPETPSSVALTKEILGAAKGNPYLIGNLQSDPAPIFAAAGYPMQIEDYRAFNRFFLAKAQPVLEALAGGADLEDITDAKCIGCKIGFWSLAALITGIGAAGLTFLSAGAAPVVALASLAGVAATTALAFIQGLATVALFTIDVILDNIRQWIGVC